MTRAAIAAADRKSKETIADKDRAAREVIEKRKHGLEEKRLNVDRVSSAAKATKDLVGAAKLFNHPEWYKKFGSDQYTAQLPTYNRVGLETALHFLSDNNQTNNNLVWSGQRVVPGIMVIEYYPTLPNQQYSSNGYKFSPVNVGLARFMSELRKMNSRIGDYDASDFGLYWYAAVDYLWLIQRTRTAIEAYNTYFIDNAYYARALIKALGFDDSNFIAHIAEFKYLIDRHINTFNSSIVLPMNLTFIQRRAWLARAIVKDHKSSVSQLYIFRQLKLGVLSEDEGSVNYQGPTVFNNWNLTTTENTLNTMLSRLTNSVGMQTMMADLRAGIPESNFIKLESLDASKTIDFIEGDYELEQIHNLQTLPVFANDSTGAFNPVSPDNSTINIHAMADGFIAQGTPNAAKTALTTPGIAFNTPDNSQEAGIIDYATIDRTPFLNFYDDAAGNDDILEATRLRCGWRYDDDNSQIYVGIRGTEVVSHLTIYVYTYAKVLNAITLGTYITGSKALDFEGEACALLSRFDWCPIVTFIGYQPVDDNYEYTGFYTFGELDKIVLCNNDNLMLLHEQCSLSLFYVDSKEFLKAR